MSSRQISIFITLALAACLVSGCASRAIRASKSFQAEGCPVAGIEVVANHLSNELAAIYPPGHTTIYLHQADNPGDTLGAALDQALRSRGFVMAAESGGQVLALSYVLDRLDQDSWYTRLNLSNGLTLTRTYQDSGELFQVEGGARTDHMESGNGQR